MKELLEEDEKEEAAAAAGSQKKKQAKAGQSEKKKTENVAAVAVVARLKDKVEVEEEKEEEREKAAAAAGSQKKNQAKKAGREQSGETVKQLLDATNRQKEEEEMRQKEIRRQREEEERLRKEEEERQKEETDFCRIWREPIKLLEKAKGRKSALGLRRPWMQEIKETLFDFSKMEEDVESLSGVLAAQQHVLCTALRPSPSPSVSEHICPMVNELEGSMVMKVVEIGGDGRTRACAGSCSLFDDNCRSFHPLALEVRLHLARVSSMKEVLLNVEAMHMNLDLIVSGTPTVQHTVELPAQCEPGGVGRQHPPLCKWSKKYKTLTVMLPLLAQQTREACERLHALLILTQQPAADAAPPELSTEFAASQDNVVPLRGNVIGAGGTESLAGLLAQCRALAHLNLSYFVIGLGGAGRLAGVLAQCRALAHLDLSPDGSGGGALEGDAVCEVDVERNMEQESVVEEDSLPGDMSEVQWLCVKSDNESDNWTIWYTDQVRKWYKHAV
jgi:chemotaxis protein histidine kinase CheA